MFPIHWGGVYRTDNETIKIAVNAEGEQMLLTCFKGYEEKPWFIWLALKIECYCPILPKGFLKINCMNSFLKPKLSLFHFNMSVPHLKAYPPYYSVVNYESNALDSDKSLLQKVEIYRSESHNWVVSVSEFKIEIDYFFLLSPDDQTKCIRKLQLSSMLYDPRLAMEYSSEGFSYKKEFSLRRKIIDQNFLFKNLPDRKISEEKARRIFFDFQREQWGINDGILSQELIREEKELERRWIIAEVSRKKQVQEQDNQELDVHIPEDEALSDLESFDGEMVTDIAPTKDEKRLLTEDELWESRDLLYPI